MNNYSGSLEGLVNNFPTKHKEGFTIPEIDKLIQLFPNIEISKFDDALLGNTIMVRNGDHINYHCDILTALKCGVENRTINLKEWD
tara:strand:- start:315 stop:572 length:258 start_codon:yes stop_codon:yes gene_type:complete